MFGCRAFAHVPDNERSKLDGKSKECIFLGYSHDQFGYRLWDPEKQRCSGVEMWSSLRIKPLRI